MAEATAKTIQEVAPNLPNPGGNTNKRIIYVKGTTANANDTITVTDLTTVDGGFLVTTAGVSAAPTFATNVLTVTAAAGTYAGLVWGT